MVVTVLPRMSKGGWCPEGSFEKGRLEKNVLYENERRLEGG
jgi:hypothetical protein